MEVPCPVWLQGPWSPVGYDVVEVTDRNRPANGSSAPAIDHLEEVEPDKPAWSPVGYRIVEVDGDRFPDVAPRPAPARQASEATPRRKRRPLMGRKAIAIGCACLVAVAFLSGLLALPGRIRPAPLVTLQVAPPGGLVCPGDNCALPAGSEERETFGTSIQFIRNPREAGRVAAAERKLTFLLHVSGNFEESGFT